MDEYFLWAGIHRRSPQSQIPNTKSKKSLGVAKPKINSLRTETKGGHGAENGIGLGDSK